MNTSFQYSALDMRQPRLPRGRRRRWLTQQKIAIVRESFEPGKTVACVADWHGINRGQLYTWRKRYQNGALSSAACNTFVPAIELIQAIARIGLLERLLGQATIENRFLREAMSKAPPVFGTHPRSARVRDREAIL